MPEVRTGVVAVGKLQHVIAGAAYRTEIIAVGEVEIPNGTGAELPVAVFVEKGAFLVNIHIGSQLAHDHIVHEGWNVDIGGETVTNILIVSGYMMLDDVEVVFDIVALRRGDLIGFRDMVDVVHILPIIVRRG